MNVAFQKLKDALCSAPVMQIPDFSQPLVIECDASGSVAGTVLIQNGHPVAYFSKMLAGKSKLLLHIIGNYWLWFWRLQSGGIIC